MTLPPQASPPKIPTFVCDEMLQRLGRWLRTAGYDVVMADEGDSDYELLRRAIDEQRLLITRDRGLAKMRRAKGTVILLLSESLELCAEELAEKLSLNWQLDPFCRCLQCNSLLTSPPDTVISPGDVMGEIYYCPTCQQVFWDGSHVQRMREHLARWQAKQYQTSLS